MIIFQTKNSVLHCPKNQKRLCENNLLLQRMEEKLFKLKRMHQRYINFSSNFHIYEIFYSCLFQNLSNEFFYFAFSDLLSGL